MNKVMKFVDKYGLPILLVLILLSTCTSNISKKTREKKLDGQFDSLKVEIKTLKDEFKKEIKIEGLKAEKRMIQSTDRKIFDVTRQVEIDKELKVLDK